MFSTLINKFTVLFSAPKNWLSLFAGLSLVFSYAPFSLWWLPFISISLWLTILRNSAPRTAIKHGFLFGLGWFASGISWVHVAIDQFGGLPLAISVLLMLLLCMYLAIFPALASYFSARCSINRQVNLWLLSAFWLIAEYLRGVLLTGFPWLSLGYSQLDGPLVSLAPLIGEFGLNSVILLLCVSIIQLLYRTQVTIAALVIASVFISAFITHDKQWVSSENEQVSVALVQGNIKQEIKWAPEQEWPTMLKYLDLTRVNYDADIIVWPESAITALEPMAQDFLSMANKSSHLQNSAIITGILNYNFETQRYYNSLVVLGNKHRSDTEGNYAYNHANRYSKYHLLPIGEFVPFQEWLRPLAPLFNLPQSSFSKGDFIQPNLVANDITILPLICFEIAFPAQLSANFQSDTNMLLTVSNDSWFGDSHGPHQHLDIARMRALEFGRPLIRATNNGVTATVDHLGNITGVIPQFTEKVLKVDVTLVNGQTPYAQWGAFTQWLLALATLLILLTYNVINTVNIKRASK